jgi:hypothetical protein
MVRHLQSVSRAEIPVASMITLQYHLANRHAGRTITAQTRSAALTDVLMSKYGLVRESTSIARPTPSAMLGTTNVSRKPAVG